MKEFKLKKLSLDRATRFRAYYTKCAAADYTKALMREFASLKSMNQWIDRSEMEFDFMLVARYALIDNGWECFVTVGNRNITLSELDKIVMTKKQAISDFKLPISDFKLPPFSGRTKNDKRQKSENEEGESSTNII